jgi:hypothetical protein
VVNSHPLLPVELPGNYWTLEVQGERLEGKALNLKNNLYKNRCDDKEKLFLISFEQGNG